MSGRVTIYSIAEDLNLHPSTVSRALSRPELVRADVRDRVLHRADQVGYRPNRAARNLVSGRTQMLGLLIPDVENPFFPPLIRAVQKAADAHEFDTLLLDAELTTRREADLLSRVRQQVDGLVIASPMSSAQQLVQAAGNTPAVLLNRTSTRFPSVVFDHTDALHQAGALLYEFGHRRVALLRGPSESWAAQQRGHAVQQWAERTDVELVDLGHYSASYDGGLEAAAELSPTGATAAFAFDDLMACGVLAGLAEHGVSVPDSFSLVGCDDVLLSRVVTPALTTIGGSLSELADTAVSTLFRVMTSDASTPESTSLPGQLTERRSTGRRMETTSANPGTKSQGRS